MPAIAGIVFVRNVLAYSVLMQQKIFHSNESDKKLSMWERQGWSSIDKGRERGDVLAPPEKDNLIPNEKDPTMIRCIYLILLSSG